MPLLELSDVRASYGALPVLHGVSLTVEEGEIATVLGANGAGKTTTLRAVSGVVARSGRLLFNERDIARRSPDAIARLGIAHVPEGRGTFDELTVRENVRLGAYTRPRGEWRAECRRVLALFPWLEERSGQQAATLSGGEQQMLALARALVQRPRLLLLDEPSLGLAPRVAAEVFGVLRRLNADEGLTVLVVEQSAEAALETADTAYVLEAGRVVRSGSAEEVRRDGAVRRS